MQKVSHDFFPCIALAALVGLSVFATQVHARASFPIVQTLEDGTEVEIRESGQVLLRVDGREVFATADGVPPRVSIVDENLNELIGHFVFTRLSSIDADLDEVQGVRSRPSRVRVKFRSARGALRDVRRERATMDIRVGEVTGTTQIRLTPRRRLRRDSSNATALGLRCDTEASFYGFGGQYNATDQRGEAFPLIVNEQGIGRIPGEPQIPLNGTPHTTYFPMPYYLDARGFGLLVEGGHRVNVDLCAARSDVAEVEQVSTEPLELIVFHGPEPLDVISQLGDAVGRPKAPPAWAYELWVSAQGGDAAVRAEAALLRSEGIPAGVIWSQDWTGVRINFDGGKGVQYRWESDPDHYPNLAGLISDLRADGFRFLAYANPFVAKELPNHYPEMAARGLLIKNAAGVPLDFLAPNLFSSHADFTIPEAREYVKDALRAMVNDYGIDGWMADFGEWTPIAAVNSAGMDPVVFHNTYPVEWHRLTREVMDEVRPDGDWVSFARSGWTGVHEVSMIHWIGDQETDWSEHDGLPTVVPAMLNLGISGIPYVTHDIAGFSGTTADPTTKQLFLRWTELGAFTPYMRTHEGADRDNNWDWKSDTETIDHFRRFSLIHQLLGPELQALASAAQVDSAPIVRHLMLEFPADPGCAGISDQFLLGGSLLVAPVTEEDATEREVYFPAGATWFDVWTGASYSGGQTLTIAAPIGSPPVFSRDSDRSDLRSIP